MCTTQNEWMRKEKKKKDGKLWENMSNHDKASVHTKVEKKTRTTFPLSFFSPSLTLRFSLTLLFNLLFRWLVSFKERKLTCIGILCETWSTGKLSYCLIARCDGTASAMNGRIRWNWIFYCFAYEKWGKSFSISISKIQIESFGILPTPFLRVCFALSSILSVESDLISWYRNRDIQILNRLEYSHFHTIKCFYRLTNVRCYGKPFSIPLSWYCGYCRRDWTKCERCCGCLAGVSSITNCQTFCLNIVSLWHFITNWQK